MGFEHLLGGADHMLFVLGMVLLLRDGRRLLVAVTGFTLGHSVTLSLATLGFVQVPSALVEVGIAASLFWLATRLARAGQGGERLAHPFGGSRLRSGSCTASASPARSRRPDCLPARSRSRSSRSTSGSSSASSRWSRRCSRC